MGPSEKIPRVLSLIAIELRCSVLDCAYQHPQPQSYASPTSASQCLGGGTVLPARIREQALLVTPVVSVRTFSGTP
jgi:hypothetical protein